MRGVSWLVVTPVIAMSVAACGKPAQRSPFADAWVAKYHGRNLIWLTITVTDGRVAGTLNRPMHMNYDQDGDFSGISQERTQAPIEGAALDGNRLTYSITSNGDTDRFSMSLSGPDRATLDLVGALLPPIVLQRAQPADRAVTAWPPERFSDDVATLQSTLKKMVDEDQAVRKESTIVPTRVEAIDRAHRPILERIHQEYGWPKISLVGKEATNEFWLLVQHQEVELQRAWLPELERAVAAHDASRSNYAYLYDRVMKESGKPQHWGTQATCHDGKALMDPVDDPAGLAGRRRELFMQPIDQYLDTLTTNSCSRLPAAGGAKS